MDRGIEGEGTGGHDPECWRTQGEKIGEDNFLLRNGEGGGAVGHVIKDNAESTGEGGREHS